MTVSQFSPSFARLIDAACTALLVDPARSYEAICSRRFMVAFSLEKFGQGHYFPQRYEGVESFVAAVEQREPTLVAFGLQLAGAIDPRLALELATSAFDLEPVAPLDKAVKDSALCAVEENAAVAPLALLLDLALAGRIQPPLLEHPELATVAARRAVLARFEELPLDRPYYLTSLQLALFQGLMAASDEPTIDRAIAIWNDPAHSFSERIANAIGPANVTRAFEAMAARAEELADDPAAPAWQRAQSEWAIARLGDANRYAAVVVPRTLARTIITDDDRLAKARDVLSVIAQTVMSGRFPADVRAFADAGAALIEHPKLGVDAKRMLSTLDKKVVRAALDAVGVAIGKTAPKAAPMALPSRLDFVVRYHAGEHEAVWRELGVLGAAVHDPRLRTEALGVARATMERLQRNLERIVGVLGQNHYALAAKKRALPLAKDPEKKLAALEKLAGGPLPLSLRAFYERFDGVSLAEQVDARTDAYTLDPDLGRWDALVVAPLATVTKDLTAQAASNKLLIAELRDPVGFYVAPSVGTKYDPDDDVADDAPARVLADGSGMDGEVIEGARAPIPFVDWLRSYVRRGGFRAMEDEATEAALTAGLEPF
jgi:hypothetical protein